jgi:hypothetical protein
VGRVERGRKEKGEEEKEEEKKEICFVYEDAALFTPTSF